MSTPYDLIIRNGIIVTASDEFPSDIGIKDGVIAALSPKLPEYPEVEQIDAEGAYITPGGIDSHVHLAQSSSAKHIGARSADDWKSGTRSAISGGTTTVIAFAVQSRNASMLKAVEDYHKLAEKQTYTDYSFHIIISDPNEQQMLEELPKLIEGGITSCKIYTTYPSLKLTDSQVLDVLYNCRKLGATTMVHAENSDMIEWMCKSLEKKGHLDPHYHGVARPNIVEGEATNRVICLAELMDTPILLVHVSAPEATDVIRNAQTRLLPVYAETCPHYLLLSAEKMKKPDFEGAKCVCSPPLREDDDGSGREAIWRGIANGTFTVVSSDHAPTNYHDDRGKQLGLIHNPTKNANGDFRTIPNGLPGVETRVPILWSEGVLKGRITPSKFVEVTSTNAAKLYGLYPKKGALQPGSDADMIIWNNEKNRKPFAIKNEDLHHDVDYTPFEGIELQDWPRYTLLRGKVMWNSSKSGKNEKILGEAGNGMFIGRGGSKLGGPRNKWLTSWRPE